MIARNLKFIVTGCPCSGTGYTAQALFERGLKAGHEVFAVDPQGEFETSCQDGRTSQGIPLEEIEVDVSYAYADTLPHLLPSSEVQVIHLVRSPLSVLNSWLSVTLRHPALTSPEVVAAKLWCYNVNVSSSSRMIHRHRVEDPIEGLLTKMGYESWEQGKGVETNHNAHNKGRCNFSWEDLKNHPWCERLRRQYQDYGYV